NPEAHYPAPPCLDASYLVLTQCFRFVAHARLIVTTWGRTGGERYAERCTLSLKRRLQIRYLPGRGALGNGPGGRTGVETCAKPLGIIVDSDAQICGERGALPLCRLTVGETVHICCRRIGFVGRFPEHLDCL